MKKKSKGLMALSLLLILSLVTACGAPAAPEKSAPAEKKETAQSEEKNTVYTVDKTKAVIDSETDLGYINNIIIVIAKAGVSEGDVLKAVGEEKAKVVGRLPGINQFQIEIKSRSLEELQALAKKLMAGEQILYAHPDMVFSDAQEEDEPENHKPDQTKPGEDEAWKQAIRLKEGKALLATGKPAKVGIIDGGFDTENPELKLTFPSEAEKKLNNADPHGTHVAGIINQMTPGAEMVAFDAYQDEDKKTKPHIMTMSRFYKGMLDLLEKDVKVINHSGGVDDRGQQDWANQVTETHSVYLWQFIQKKYPFLVVQAAGNEGLNTEGSGDFSALSEKNVFGGNADVRKSLGITDEKAAAEVLNRIVVVGAGDDANEKGQRPLSKYSSYGPLVQIIANGSGIRSTVPGGYATMEGTSFSAPMVSGALSLLWGAHPEKTPAEMKALLLTSADPNGVAPGQDRSDKSVRAYPFLNLARAAEMAAQGPAKEAKAAA